jgi:hypothetical protein
VVLPLPVPSSCKFSSLINNYFAFYIHDILLYSQGQKTPLLQQIQTALVASVLLGFGAIFASNAAGVYL